MVLGNREKLVACSTAAGPALEGANISCGMTARPGAIDHILPDGTVRVIGGGKAEGLCGSGLIDAVAVALSRGELNRRGKIRSGDCIGVAEGVSLTQEDIRQVQLAKGAIRAGIDLLCAHIGVKTEDIQKVYLAGAFGSFMHPASACRIGLLPPELEKKVTAIGNAAGDGAVLLAKYEKALIRAETLSKKIPCLNLSVHKDFPKAFAQGMTFLENSDPKYWVNIARKCGFFAAFPLEINTLSPCEDVRKMCAADKCGAYGKNWTCPPYCGTLAECDEQMRGYQRGILVQTVGKLEKTVDTKGYRRTEEQHLVSLHKLYEVLRKTYPNALCLGSGGCRVCKTCAHPEPCRFPEKAISSMEAYGLFVTQVCRDNGAQYYHGEKTITYTACILF
jgi:predicted metal-binding protein